GSTISPPMSGRMKNFGKVSRYLYHQYLAAQVVVSNQANHNLITNVWPNKVMVSPMYSGIQGKNRIFGPSAIIIRGSYLQSFIGSFGLL
ncbi:7442_t:CDS:1, partial [Gigaspora rosea]